MNPYLHPIWSQWIRGAHHGGARALQNLALHLYNSRDWPVDLSYLCSMSDDHWEAAQAMILDYRENGENNAAFIALCEEIAEARRGFLGDPGPCGIAHNVYYVKCTMALSAQSLTHASQPNPPEQAYREAAAAIR